MDVELTEISEMHVVLVTDQIAAWESQLMHHEMRIKEEQGAVLRIGENLGSLRKQQEKLQKMINTTKKKMVTAKLSRDNKGRFLPLPDKANTSMPISPIAVKQEKPVLPSKRRKSSRVQVPQVKEEISLPYEELEQLAVGPRRSVGRPKSTGVTMPRIKKEGTAIQQRKNRTVQAKRSNQQKMKTMMELSASAYLDLATGAVKTPVVKRVQTKRRASLATPATIPDYFQRPGSPELDIEAVDEPDMQVMIEPVMQPRRRTSFAALNHVSAQYNIPSSPESLKDGMSGQQRQAGKMQTAARVREYKRRTQNIDNTVFNIDSDLDILN